MVAPWVKRRALGEIERARVARQKKDRGRGSTAQRRR